MKSLWLTVTAGLKTFMAELLDKRVRLNSGTPSQFCHGKRRAGQCGCAHVCGLPCPGGGQPTEYWPIPGPWQFIMSG